MAVRRRGNMTPPAGMRVSSGQSFSKGGKRSKRKYACGGRLKK